MSDKPIRIAVIKGSVRPNNYTSMAVALVVDELQKDPQVHVQVIDPSEYNLPMPGTDWSAPGAKRLQEAVKKATAIVLATPEYHGSFSSVMKLVIENLGFPSALQGKPVALMGVAAGAIGAIKSLEQLRSVAAHRRRDRSANASVRSERAIGVRFWRPHYRRCHREYDSRGCPQRDGIHSWQRVSTRDAGTVDA